MTVKDEFEQGLKKYRRLNLAWTTAIAILFASYLLVSVHWVLSAALFFVGAVNLGAAGITCAYTIAKENI